MAEGSNRLAARKRRIERAPAPADEEPKGHESTLDNLARGPARRRGRPALPAEEGKRYPVGIRTTKALREALWSASRASGRSLAQEIEFRLERSLDRERQVVDALELVFDRQVAGLMLAIGCVVKQARPKPRRHDWLSDPEAFRVQAEAINLLLQALAPDAHPKVWAKLNNALDETDEPSAPELTAGIAARVLADTKEEIFHDLGPWVSTIRSWLGAAVIARLRDRFVSSPSPTRLNPE